MIDLTETLDLVKGLEARGASYIVESAGNPSLTLPSCRPTSGCPNTSYLHFWFQKQLRSALKPETVLIGSGYSIFRDGKNTFRGVKEEESSLVYWGNKNISDGVCDMVAIGRQSLADPLLPPSCGGQGGRDQVVHVLRQLHRVPDPAEAGGLLDLRARVHGS